MQTLQNTKARAEQHSPGFLRFLVLGLAVAVEAVLSATAQTQGTIRTMTVAGNRAIATSEIKNWMRSREGGSFDAEDLARIVAGYVNSGYIFAGIDSLALAYSEDSTYVDVSIAIHEGNIAIVSSLLLTGAGSIPERDLIGKMETRPGNRFLPRLLEEDIARLLREYERAGYPFAKISVGDITFQERTDQTEASIELWVSEGGLVRLAGLRVEGNTSTRTDVIQREAGVSAGQLFRADQLERIKRRLERTQLFSSVSLPELAVDPDGTARLFVKVAEGNPNRFDGIAGYVPAGAAGGDGYLTGLLDVEFRNILGTGRQLAARWFRENETTQEVALRYREPWVASLPVNAEIGVLQRKQDSTYVHRQYSVLGDITISDEWSVGLSFSQSSVFPAEGFGKTVIGESQTTNVGVAVSYDSRDDPVTPTEGVRYRTQYQTGFKRITSPVPGSSESRNTTQRLTADVEYYLSLFTRQVLATNVFVRDVRSASIDMSDLWRLGGASTLRGYREGQFLGSRLICSNVEYRVLFGRRSYLLGFVDIGYIATPDLRALGLNESELTKIGYGAGVRLDSPLGILGVSLAFGQGDTFSTAKLHLRLTNEF